MKTQLSVLLILISFLSKGQCPQAGNDTIAEFCKYEIFNVASLTTVSADSGGVFIDPWMDTMQDMDTSFIFPGLYTYRYIVSDSGCIADSATIIVKIIYCFPASIQNSELNNPLTLYPNPASEWLQLHGQNFDEFQLIDLEGKTHLHLVRPIPETINISQLSPGWYIVRLKNNNNVFTEKHLITRP